MHRCKILVIEDEADIAELIDFNLSREGYKVLRTRCGGEVLDRNIDVHIRAIRGKLGSYRDLIETVRGAGYRFKEEE